MGEGLGKPLRLDRHVWQRTIRAESPKSAPTPRAPGRAVVMDFREGTPGLDGATSHIHSRRDDSSL